MYKQAKITPSMWRSLLFIEYHNKAGCEAKIRTLAEPTFLNNESKIKERLTQEARENRKKNDKVFRAFW